MQELPPGVGGSTGAGVVIERTDQPISSRLRQLHPAA
jgi:hypothetical protein